jgi:putative endonuclease
MYFTYIIYCDVIDKYYIGSTNDLERRLQDHQRGKDRFSRQGKNWQLKHFETFHTRQQAYERELEIKRKKSRPYIEKLISSAGSEHPDL